MNTNKVLVKFGNGAKTHVGSWHEYEGRAPYLYTGCGSRQQGTSKRVVGDLNWATYVASADACTKCVANYTNLTVDAEVAA